MSEEVHHVNRPSVLKAEQVRNPDLCLLLSPSFAGFNHVAFRTGL
jgi:hypothetical protein